MYDEEDCLALSGIQHFAFCRRQWALIHIEQAWADNILTVQGDILHERTHDEEVREHRGNTIVVRGLSVRSLELGLAGKCDVVEFHRGTKGHPLFHEDGLWTEFPVEYKRGRSKASDADRLQLCAQAMCLEEMFGSDVPFGCLFYGETKSRERVELGSALRQKVAEMTKEMHRHYARKHTPKASPTAACRSCSLVDLCIPKLQRQKSVADYIAARIKEPI